MMTPDWPGRERAARLRQWPTLDGIIRYVAVEPAFAAAILVGSLAAGRTDALSDIDLLLFAADGCFEAAWQRRFDLHGTGALAAWDAARRIQWSGRTTCLSSLCGLQTRPVVLSKLMEGKRRSGWGMSGTPITPPTSGSTAYVRFRRRWRLMTLDTSRTHTSGIGLVPSG